jgi:hypothetical protein
MSKAAISVKLFSYYALAMGLLVVFAPQIPLALFGLKPSSDIWFRFVGILAFNIGIYYWFAAQAEATGFFKASVFTRVLVFVACIVFVLLGLADKAFALVGGADLLGAIWTAWALQQDRAG